MFKSLSEHGYLLCLFVLPGMKSFKNFTYFLLLVMGLGSGRIRELGEKVLNVEEVFTCLQHIYQFIGKHLIFLLFYPFRKFHTFTTNILLAFLHKTIQEPKASYLGYVN